MKKYETIKEPTFPGRAEAREFARTIDWIMKTDIFQIDAKEEELKASLRDFGWEDEQSFWVGLCFREAVSNAMIHGNMHEKKSGVEDAGYEERWLAKQKLDEYKNKKVWIKGEITKNQLKITIQDQGGEDGKKLALQVLEEDPLNTGLYKPSGRGNLIMQNTFGNGVNYELNELGTKVALARKKELITAEDVLDFWKGRIVKIEVGDKMEDGWEVVGASGGQTPKLTLLKNKVFNFDNRRHAEIEDTREVNLSDIKQ